MPANQRTLVAVTLIVTCVFAVLLAEGVLRLFGPTPKLVYQPNAYYGWGYRPNDTFSWTTEGREIPIEINSLGLRDHEYSYEKPEGVSRVLVLGDSFPEALQVHLDDSFSKVLERALNTRGRSVEVLNAGMSGFGTDNALLYFTHEGYKYQPDIVLLSFYVGNDIRNNWHTLEELDVGGSRKPHFEITQNGLALRDYPFVDHESFGTRARLFMNRNVRLYSFARDLRDRMRATGAAGGDASSGVAKIPLDLQVFEIQPSVEWERAWQVTDGVLHELRDEVAARGASLFVVVVPTAFQIHPEIWDARLGAIPGLRNIAW